MEPHRRRRSIWRERRERREREAEDEEYWRRRLPYVLEDDQFERMRAAWREREERDREYLRERLNYVLSNDQVDNVRNARNVEEEPFTSRPTNVPSGGANGDGNEDGDANINMCGNGGRENVNPNITVENARIHGENNIVLNVPDRNKKNITLCFAVTNARSLWKKVESLADAFKDLELDVAVITETWFYKSPALDKLVCDAEQGEALGFINCMRTKQGRLNTGGGVSIVYNKNKITGSQYNTKKSGSEIIVGKFKIKQDSRCMFVIGVYLSTRMTKKEADKCIQTIIITINKIKLQHENPYIILGGDFNNYDITPILEDFADLKLHLTAPTRGNNTLDLAITNIEDKISNAQVYPPLRNEDSGTDSDHGLVVFNASWQHSHAFKWIITKRRDTTKTNIQNCISRINDYDWQELGEGNADDMARKFHDRLMKICLLYTSPSPRDLSTSRMPSSA